MLGISEYTNDEHRVMYRIVESLFDTTPETNITLYVNYPGIFIKWLTFKRNINYCLLFVKKIRKVMYLNGLAQ